MKKLSTLLLFMLLSFITTAANVTSESHDSYKIRAIQLEKWDQSSRSVTPNPIECYLIDKNIEVRFFKYPETPITIQIKDTYGNIVYQNMDVINQQEILNIEIDQLQPGSYEFFYFDEKISLKGKFEIE
ncbi:DUF3244 domain-containing protein [Bacteroides acidifaciens]|uniref:DUF3244 domain-containing protein n=2 Tax=Bacteroidales TaxID=171549 RepID=UPI00158C8558|nr:DUF3244 domain-containing protein [Bacteroides acidifaciens]